jgi:hypothetical protein
MNFILTKPIMIEIIKFTIYNVIKLMYWCLAVAHPQTSFSHKSRVIVFVRECLSIITDSFMKSCCYSKSSIDIMLLGLLILFRGIYSSGSIVLLRSSSIYRFGVSNTLNSNFIGFPGEFNTLYDGIFTVYRSYVCEELYENLILVNDLAFYSVAGGLSTRIGV